MKMNTDHIQPRLTDIPFENLRVGDKLIGANGANGKITELDPGTYHSGGEDYTGWMVIEWDNGNVSQIPQDDGSKVIYVGR